MYAASGFISDAERYGPRLRSGLRSDRQRPFLRQFQFRPCAAFQGSRNLRDAGLLQEAVENRRNICASGAPDSRLEIASGRVTPGVLLQIKLDAGTKFLRADPMLEHLDYRSALLVRNIVERVRDIVDALDRLPDGAGGSEFVLAHRT